MSVRDRHRGDPPRGEVLDLSEVATAVRHRKGLVLLVTILVAGLAALYSYTRVPTYVSQAEILVSPTLTNPLQSNQQDQLSLQTEMSLVTSAAVADIADKSLGSTSSMAELLKHVSVSVPQDTQILEIAFKDKNPRRAQAGAQAFAEAYLKFKSNQAAEQVASYKNSLENQITQLTDEINSLNRKILSLGQRISNAQGPADRTALLAERDALQGKKGNAEANRLSLQNDLSSINTLINDPGQIIQPAELPKSPTSPKHKLDIALGVLLGLAAGVGIAWARERLQDRIQGRRALEEYLQAPVLGTIPKLPTSRRRAGVVTLDEPRSSGAEAYRTLRTNILALGGGQPPRSLLVTSAWTGEGKSTTAANLAVVLAQVGREVILLSADLRLPVIHRFFDIPNERGLGQVLSDGLHPFEALWDSPVPRLRIMPSGPPSQIVEPVELLQSERMREVLAQCSQEHIVLLDSPPVSGVADTLVMAPMVDGVLFVANARGGEPEAVMQARYQLRQVGGHVLGGVLNGLEEQRRAAGYASYAPPDTRGRLLDRLLLSEPGTNGHSPEREDPTGSRGSGREPAPRS